MRHWRFLAGVLIAVVSAASFAPDADARRLGGGAARGMQRAPAQQTPPQQATPPAPQQPAPAQAARQSPAPAAPAAAQTAPRRSWMGPIAGLAAGLGLAALFSHLGLGAELANAVMLGLLLVAGFLVLRWLLRRMAGAPLSRPMPATAGAPTPRFDAAPGATGSTSLPAGGTAAAASQPRDFDAPAFEHAAKLIFVRMQAANDAADMEELRRYTTPQMLEAVAEEMRQREGQPQRTDVVQLEAQVLDVAQENGRDVVSVQYRGLVREEDGSGAHPFVEVWHLVRSDDDRWLLAGIQPSAA